MSYNMLCTRYLFVVVFVTQMCTEAYGFLVFNITLHLILIPDCVAHSFLPVEVSPGTWRYCAF